MHNSIVHTENGFRGVPVAVAYRGKRSDQVTTMFSGMSALSLFNTERRWPRFQKPGFRKHRSNIDIHASLAVVTFILFPIYSLPFATSWIYILPTPKLMTLLNSVYHSIRSSEVDVMLSFSHARSVVHCKRDLRDGSSTTFARDTQYICVRFCTTTYWNDM